MLTYLAELDHLFGPLRLFSSLTFRSVMAAGTALLVGWWLGPLIIRRLRNFKQALRDRAEVGKLADLHAKKAGTPTMGGLLIYASVTSSVLLWAEPNIYILTALYVYTTLTMLGFADDYRKVKRKHSRGLPGRYKLAAQAFIAMSTMGMLIAHPESSGLMRELWVPFWKEPLFAAMPIPVMALLYFLVLAGSSNAINLTDGMDGLAIGCTVTVALVYGIMAYIVGHAVMAEHLLVRFVPGSGELAVVCATLVGASLAFLWFNAHPAEIFMGDTGSLALGGLVGVIALMILQPFTLVLVGGIFVLEALSVILQVGSFQTTRRRIFRMAPIHHHFELGGWPETKVVIRFWILSLVFAIAGLATLKIR